jgi:NitT/TauT family transport system substrate-binding protein
MRHKIVAVVALVLALIATISASSKAAEPVIIFTGLDTGYAPLYIAELRGMFEKNGVNAKVITFTSGAEAVTAVRSSGAGYVLGGDFPTVKAWVVGDIFGIAPVSWSTANISIVARADIKSAADLRGKKIGVVVGSAPQITLVNYLLKNGLTLDDVKQVNLTPGDMVPALARDDIHALIWGATVTTPALEAVRGAHYLQRGSAGYGVDRTILAATKTTLQGNPDTTLGVLRAFREAVEYIRSNPTDAADAVAKRLKLPPRTVSDQMGLWHYDMEYNQDFVEFMNLEIQTAVRLHILERAVDLKSSFETKYLGQVDQRLVSAH